MITVAKMSLYTVYCGTLQNKKCACEHCCSYAFLQLSGAFVGCQETRSSFQGPPPNNALSSTIKPYTYMLEDGLWMCSLQPTFAEYSDHLMLVRAPKDVKHAY